MLKDLTKDNGFKNETSRRFYEWCKVLIDSGELSSTRLATVLGKYEANPSRILSDLKTGKLSVTVEWIVACQEKLGLNPQVLFGGGELTLKGTVEKSYQKSGDVSDKFLENLESKPDVIEDPAEEIVKTEGFVGFASSGAARQIHHLLQKHRIGIEKYANQHLSISRQQYYQYVNGNSRLPFDIVQKVCEDLGESLDVFRSKPLPEGHLIDRLSYLSELVKAKDEIIELLKSQARLSGKSIDQKKVTNN